MLPVIAIVGRPNVGKSTLFNRLTHTRNAIISAIPGTTRDRQFGKVEWDDREFIIIDTGGLTDENEPIDHMIAEQTDLAIQEASSIIFLIDGRAGVTPHDKDIAEHLRKLNKKIFLVVNKIEGLDPQSILADAYELGLSAPIGIAAVHGIGISKLVEAVTPAASKEDIEQPTDSTPAGIKFAIVGRPNVGKSTLTNRMLGEERVIVHDMPGTTRDSINIPLERHGEYYTIIDTAGVRRKKKVYELPEKFSIVKTLQSIQEANVVVYVIDARLGVSDQDQKLLSFILEAGRALVIAINKWDDMTESARNAVKSSVDRSLDFVRFARVHYISALHGSGVGNLFDSTNEAYESATKKLSTPQITRLLQKAIEAHSPPLVKGRRVKLRYAHPGGQNPPRIIIHGNQLNELPESYRKFLATYFQKQLGLYGTPLLIEYKTSDNPFK